MALLEHKDKTVELNGSPIPRIEYARCGYLNIMMEYDKKVRKALLKSENIDFREGMNICLILIEVMNRSQIISPQIVIPSQAQIDEVLNPVQHH
jgi:hypothetical protein